MKTIRSIFQTRQILAALLTVGAPLATAQTVDTSTGTVLDSNAAGTVVPPQNPAATRLTATLVPIDQGIATRGEIVFATTGGAVSVTGRVEGLEGDKRYQVVIRFPLITGASSPPSEAGTPAAGPPQAGTPDAPAPAAGQPDGEPRPGAPGAGTGGTSVAGGRPPNETAAAPIDSRMATTEAPLAMIVADSTGAANLNTLMQNKDLSPPPTGILGCTVVIKRAPPFDSPDDRVEVASGVISAVPIPVPAAEP